MKERPILFSAPMVLALLENRKFQTRRIIKPQPVKSESTLYPDSWVWHPNKTSAHYFNPEDAKSVDSAFNPRVYCPYSCGRLWVQEDYSLQKSGAPGHYACFYGDGTQRTVDLDLEEESKLLSRKSPITKKQPGRFMYRSCSRILLEIVDARVERLQDISEEDAIAEGIQQMKSGYWSGGLHKIKETPKHLPSPVEGFRDLWESIHGVGSWETNVWLWAVEFKKVEHGH